MCRYAMLNYKDHYACFTCQKTYKRRLLLDVDRDAMESKPARCPQCKGDMANMGKDFESPKQKDDQAWKHIRNLYQVGIAFFSCGCSGPGYIPADPEALLAYFKALKKQYESELEFWRTRIQPESKAQQEKESTKNWKKLKQVNSNFRKELVSNQSGISFWINRIVEVNQRIEQVVNQK